MRTEVVRAAGGALIAVGIALAAWSAPELVSHAAAYERDPDQATPAEMLTLSSRMPEGDTALREISPDEPAHWEILAEQDDPTGAATLGVQIGKRGQLAEHPSGLTVEIDECLEEWTGIETGSPACGALGGAVAVGPADDLAQEPSNMTYMLPLEHDRPHHFLVTVGVAESASPADDSLQGLTAEIEVGMTAALGGPPAEDPPRLVPSGGDLGAAVRLVGLVAAVTAIAAGATLLRRRPTEAS